MRIRESSTGQARLNLASLPEGAKVWIGDEEHKNSLATLDRSGEVHLRIVRPGYAEVAVRVQSSMTALRASRFRDRDFASA